eukprot:863000-Prorocentrum_minimum.AAC.4
MRTKGKFYSILRATALCCGSACGLPCASECSKQRRPVSRRSLGGEEERKGVTIYLECHGLISTFPYARNTTSIATPYTTPTSSTSGSAYLDTEVAPDALLLFDIRSIYANMAHNRWLLSAR